MSLIRTVGAGGVPTARTHLGRVAGVNPHDGDARSFGLVDDHVRKLPEGPVTHHAVEPLATPCTVTDTVKFFQDDDAARCASNDVHQFAADLVIDVPLPAAFLAFGRLNLVHAFLLVHASAVSLKASPSVLNSFARPELDDIGANQSSCFRNAQVHAEELSIVTDDGRVCGKAKGQLDVPLAVTFVELGITVGKRHGIVILLRNAEGKPDVRATMSRGNAQDPAIAIVDEFVDVNAKAQGGSVDRGPRGFLDVSGLNRSPIDMYHALRLAKGHASIVRGQVKLLTNSVVTSFVQFSKAGGLAVFVGKIQDELNSFGIAFLQGRQEKTLTFGGLYDLDNYTFHAHSKAILPQWIEHVKSRKENAHSSHG